MTLLQETKKEDGSSIYQAALMSSEQRHPVWLTKTTIKTESQCEKQWQNINY